MAIREWLADPRVTGDMLAVLVALADHADAAGICWPSQGRIADRLGWSRQRVGRLVSQLVEAGLIRTRQLRRSDLGRSVLEYEVLALASAPAAAAAADMTAGGQGDDTDCNSRSTDQNEELSLGAANPPTRATVDDVWQPSADTMAKARRDRPDLELSAVLDKFRAYHSGRVLLHPDRSFLLWTLRERDASYASAPNTRSHRQRSCPQPAREPRDDVDRALLRFRLRRGATLE